MTQAAQRCRRPPVGDPPRVALALWRCRDRSQTDRFPYRGVVRASVCEICVKKPWFGKSLSHSHRRTNRRWNPNIQRVRAVVGKSTKRMNVCTGCIKAGKVVKAGH